MVENNRGVSSAHNKATNINTSQLLISISLIVYVLPLHLSYNTNLNQNTWTRNLQKVGLDEKPTSVPKAEEQWTGRTDR